MENVERDKYVAGRITWINFYPDPGRSPDPDPQQCLYFLCCKVNEAFLWELFVQAGPVVNVHMPKDRVTTQHQVRYPILL
jgi:RNA recognition motif-containing protein